VDADRGPAPALAADHAQGRFTLGRTGGRCGVDIDDQAVGVLHQHMGHVHQACPMTRRLAKQSRIRVAVPWRLLWPNLNVNGILVGNPLQTKSTQCRHDRLMVRLDARSALQLTGNLVECRRPIRRHDLDQNRLMLALNPLGTAAGHRGTS